MNTSDALKALQAMVRGQGAYAIIGRLIDGRGRTGGLDVMQDTRRFLVLFAAAIVGASFLHELGHAVAGGLLGVAVVPTPFKEYVLRPEIAWREYAWIALVGVGGSVFSVLGTLAWYLKRDRASGDAILAGALLIPLAYTVRYLLAGRGHDGLEWQAAQSALGADPSGHVVDIVFLVLFVAGFAAWLLRRRASLGLPTVARLAGLVVVGIVFVIVFQVANNRLFDPFFPKTRILDAPPLSEAVSRGTGTAADGSQEQVLELRIAVGTGRQEQSLQPSISK